MSTSGTLYVVALPIGNLEDISYRAVAILKQVDLIAAEDTRHLLKLRRAYGIETPALSYHDFNEQRRALHLVEQIQNGQNIALVSDAGTPLISDPGYRLVRAAIEANVPVTSLPGPNAAITALAASGMPTSQFRFLGFAPRSSERRRGFFSDLVRDPSSLIFYEAPHRLIAMITDLHAVMGNREACLARNITKDTESYSRGSLADILHALAQESKVRGEATVIVAGSGQRSSKDAFDDHPDTDAESPEAMIEALVEAGIEPTTIVQRVKAAHALPRREIYSMVVAARERAR